MNEVPDLGWLDKTMSCLTDPVVLSAEERDHLNRHLQGVAGVGIDGIADAAIAWPEKKAILERVNRAVVTANVMLLPVTPVGRVNPLAPVAPVVTATPVMPAVVIPAPPVRSGQAVVPVDPSSAASQLLEAFTAIARGVTPSAPAALDESKVKAIAEAVLAEKWDATSDNVATLVSNAIDRLEAAAKGQPQRIEITLDGAKVIDLGTEPRHWQFEQVLTWLAADVPVWLWGKAGGGKTHLARQLAAALEMEATVVSVDPTMTVGKLVGYRNLATGEYVEGFLLKPYRDGGLLMLDELDTGDPGIIAALNALLANGHYLFPNGETVERHPKFRVLAGANTKGTGAVAGYTARQKLDAATLNRFGVIELAYDERLEEVLTCGDSDLVAPKWNAVHYVEGADRRWVTWVRKVRAQVGNSVLVSPRASYLGVKALRAGVPVADVAEALVFALVSSDTKHNLLNSCGRPS